MHWGLHIFTFGEAVDSTRLRSPYVVFLASGKIGKYFSFDLIDCLESNFCIIRLVTYIGINWNNNCNCLSIHDIIMMWHLLPHVAALNIGSIINHVPQWLSTLLIYHITIEFFYTLEFNVLVDFETGRQKSGKKPLYLCTQPIFCINIFAWPRYNVLTDFEQTCLNNSPW